MQREYAIVYLPELDLMFLEGDSSRIVDAVDKHSDLFIILQKNALYVLS